jgi:hypothetical protein
MRSASHTNLIHYNPENPGKHFVAFLNFYNESTLD